MNDPFDAEHPNNLPAFYDNEQALAEAELWNPNHTLSEWRAIRDEAHEYPYEVGFDATTNRLHLPVGFDEWNEVHRHPCWTGVPRADADVAGRPGDRVHRLARRRRRRAQRRGDASATDPAVPVRPIHRAARGLGAR